VAENVEPNKLKKATLPAGRGRHRTRKNFMAGTKRTLLDVKLALVAKYESLAKQTGSKPRQKRYFLRAQRYRSQAATIQATQR
jgi:hypothetical protein